MVFGKIFPRAQVVVHGTVVQESPQRRGRNPTIQTLGDESWDSTEEVLGQCSLGTVQSWDSLGTVQSWDSLGPEQSWYGLGTVQSWESGLGTVFLGQWSWYNSLGTVVLGH